jgi:tRNA-Thr(GGU) m(6)t(6)A37 methyltransferase TsaA
LVAGDALVILLWFGQARRDLILQAPRHRPEPRGTFALRSPVRPNPIGLDIVHILTLDLDAGRIAVDALDAFDGTPVLDIKPWIAAIDIPGGA